LPVLAAAVAAAISTLPLLLSDRPALRTAPGLVDEAFARKELLLGGAESEIMATIRAA